MEKREASRLFYECRDWATLQEMMSEDEYREFLQLVSDLH